MILQQRCCGNKRKSIAKGKQMRWHPAVIRWCVAMHSKSASAYNLMRSSGFLQLPHPSTLHRYTHFADPQIGFNSALLERVVMENNISGNAEESNNVCLLFDEMKIKSGLVYSVRSGQIVGFTDVGDIANEIGRFERRCKGEEESELASHVLVVMVRGIDSSLHSPVAMYMYPTTGVTSEQLYPCLWECVRYVEAAGMAVRAFVADGASSNRKFIGFILDAVTMKHTASCTPRRILLTLVARFSSSAMCPICSKQHATILRIQGTTTTQGSCS
jgi:hypothetical protein